MSMKIFDIAGSSLSAQSVRLSTVASNLANAESVSGSADGVYKARMPVFRAETDPAHPDTASVRVLGVVESQTEALKRYEPGHPLADKDGYVYAPNINVVEEMVNMIETQRAYEMNSKAVETVDQMLQFASQNL